MIPISEFFPQQVKEVRRQPAFSPETSAYAPRVSFVTVNQWNKCKMASSELAQRQLERVGLFKQNKES